MPKVSLSGHELELLKVAVPFAQEIQEQEGRYPTQEELRDKLKCRSVNAKHIQHHLVETNAVKVAERIQAIPERAEEKAVVQFALGDTSGTLVSHVLRENSRLSRRLAKNKFEQEAQTAARYDQVKEELESLLEQAKAGAPKPKKIKREETKSGNMLLVNIPDAHFGKLAWPVETGGRPYDVQIAAEVYKAAARTIVARALATGLKFEEVVYVIGNDILNSNDAENKTAHGTIVTTDGRYHKTFRKLRETIVELIEEFREVAPVRVVPVYGNHDTLSAYHLGDSIECYFYKYDDVKVENDPKYRKYYQFGKVMIMWTHGDKGKQDDFPLLMATEQPQMWSDTLFREVQTGHRHKTKLDEFHGVRVRILSALCPADDWHSENGYVGNLRSAEGQIWNKNEGLISIVYYNDDAFPETKTKREIVNN